MTFALGRHDTRPFTVLLIAVLGLMACASPPDADAAPVRIMPLGDSITDGYNVPGGYRIELEDMLSAAGREFDFVGSLANGPGSLADREHEGHSGLRIDELALLVDGALDRNRPDVVLLMIGTNDVLQGHRLEQAPQRLSDLIDRIATRAPSATILVSTLTPLGAPALDERVRRFNATVPAMVRDKAAQRKRVRFVDMYSALTTADLADGVHPNTTGYRRMAGVWRDALTPEAAAVTPPAHVAPVIAPVASPDPLSPALSPVSGPVPGVEAPRRLLRVPSRRLRADRRGVVRLSLACHRAADSPCSGRVRLLAPDARRGRRPLAARRFRVRPGETVRVALTIDRREHRRLRRRSSSMRVSIETTMRRDGRRHVNRTAGRLTTR